MKIEIKSRWTGAVIFSGDFESLKEAVEKAVFTRADLTGANLAGADLTGASLARADLTGANLARANLTGANLTGASLAGADLTGADLTRASLTGASLTGAHLTGADLTGADLTRASLTGAYLAGASLASADLTGAYLAGADLTGAYLAGASLASADLTGAYLAGASLTRASLAGARLTSIRDDVRAILDASPAEVPALLAALRAGRVDGSTYEGECACLCGTIANARDPGWSGNIATVLGPKLLPDSSRPAERWALAIRKGDTPATSPVSAVTTQWVEEWLAEHAKTARAK